MQSTDANEIAIEAMSDTADSIASSFIAATEARIAARAANGHFDVLSPIPNYKLLDQTLHIELLIVPHFKQLGYDCKVQKSKLIKYLYIDWG